MGYKPVNNTKKTPYNYTLHKKDKIHLVRLEALLSISATRFFPLSTLPINNYQAPSLMYLSDIFNFYSIFFSTKIEKQEFINERERWELVVG